MSKRGVRVLRTEWAHRPPAGAPLHSALTGEIGPDREAVQHFECLRVVPVLREPVHCRYHGQMIDHRNPDVLPRLRPASPAPARAFAGVELDQVLSGSLDTLVPAEPRRTDPPWPGRLGTIAAGAASSGPLSILRNWETPSTRLPISGSARACGGPTKVQGNPVTLHRPVWPRRKSAGVKIGMP